MKTIIKYSVTCLLTGLITFSSCTDQFEKYNTNPIGVTDEELKQDFNHIGAFFPAVQMMIYCNFNWGDGVDWPFQLMQNLNADIWSGYMASATDFAGGVNNQTYSLIAGWNNAAWDYTYSYLMTNSLIITNKCAEDADAYYHFEAVNKILKVLAMSRLCDLYGPIIYSHYGEDKTGGTYDSAQDAYTAFLKDLTDAVADLARFIAEKPGSTPFANFDMAYGGDYKKWMKLANTLRLRLAMRIVKYDEATAQTEAEAAIADPNGLISTNDENFTISGSNYSHPLFSISQIWNDIYVSANVESILSGYGDARLNRMASLPKSGTWEVVKGVRTGIPNLDRLKYKADNLVSAVNLTVSGPAVLVTAAEAYFLLAEGALRGWNVGGTSAQSLYETGVTTSFDQWGASVGDYLGSSNVPATFTDQLQPEIASSPAVSTVSPNWNDATTDEQRLEKIITQKWIAGFPEGYNAWAELRRTGYPKVFPILKNDSQGVIPTELGVRRLPFSTTDQSGNPTGYADAVQKLGGPDNGATRLFWDIDKGNF